MFCLHDGFVYAYVFISMLFNQCILFTCVFCLPVCFETCIFYSPITNTFICLFSLPVYLVNLMGFFYLPVLFTCMFYRACRLNDYAYRVLKQNITAPNLYSDLNYTLVSDSRGIPYLHLSV